MKVYLFIKLNLEAMLILILFIEFEENNIKKKKWNYIMHSSFLLEFLLAHLCIKILKKSPAGTCITDSKKYQ